MDGPAVSQTTPDIVAERSGDLILHADEAGEMVYVAPSILAHASDIFVLSDLQGVITFVSPAVRRTGFSASDFVGLRYEAMMPRRHIGEMTAARERLLAGAETQSVRWRGRRGPGGDPLWLESRVTLLRDSQSGAPTAFLDVVRDVDDQVAQEEALAVARAEAESAALAKAQFLSNMSHEIRTPLTAVLGFAELLAKRQEMDDRARAYIERITGAGNALLALVNDVLDFSKLEAGMFEIRPQPTDVRALGRDVLDLFSTQAAAKGLALSYEPDPALQPLYAIDPGRLRQVLINLVGNAVKFTDRGEVALRLAPEGEALRLEVADTGAGLSPDQQAQLFQRFSQIDGSLARTHGGAGLGLAICKGVVEAMGGSIGVASAPGAGAVFHAVIPAAASEGLRSAASDPDMPSIVGLRLLVVDDHEVNRELAGRILEMRGARVEEACDGAEALRALAERPFDCVLLDLRMPGIDGREVLRRVRGEPGPNRAAPVLAFTADVDAFLGDGEFSGLVRKPLSAAAMARTIAETTARAS